jgi:hypothetical protein
VNVSQTELDRFNQLKFVMLLKENGMPMKLNCKDEAMIKRKMEKVVVEEEDICCHLKTEEEDLN